MLPNRKWLKAQGQRYKVKEKCGFYVWQMIRTLNQADSQLYQRFANHKYRPGLDLKGGDTHAYNQ